MDFLVALVIILVAAVVLFGSLNLTNGFQFGPQTLGCRLFSSRKKLFAVLLQSRETSQPFFRKLQRQALCMSSYTLRLSASHYAVLIKDAARGSDAHSALMRVLPPTTDDHRDLMCSPKAIEELLDLAVRVCPGAVLEISRQIQNQLPHL